MRDQIVAYLTDVGVLNPLQSRFRPGHSTVTALLHITDYIYGILDQGYFVALVLLDFSKAFDSIDHLLLCRKLESRYGFSSSAVSFLSSYLSLPVNFGVPQGSVGLLVRSYFYFSLMISVGLSSHRITISMPMISRCMWTVEGRSCDIVRQFCVGLLRTALASTVEKHRP
jgi:hypothetical protein